MAKNKAPKKKYQPRPVYFPQLINSMMYFDPIIRALDALAERQEMKIDEHGNYVIDNGTGTLLSFAEALDVFTRYVEVFFHRMQKPAPFLNHIRALHEIVKAKLPFDYELILTVQKILVQYRDVLARIPPAMSRDILKTVKTQLAMERISPPLEPYVSPVAIEVANTQAMVLQQLVPADASNRVVLAGGAIEITTNFVGDKKEN